MNITPTADLRRMVNELSLSLSEKNHVETIDEANDFEIFDEEDQDFFQNQTVYEMHDQAEENLRLVQQNQTALAESNETGDQGEDQLPHAQSAPVEPNSLDPNQPNQAVEQPSPNKQLSPEQPHNNSQAVPSQRR